MVICTAAERMYITVHAKMKAGAELGISVALEHWGLFMQAGIVLPKFRHGDVSVAEEIISEAIKQSLSLMHRKS